MKSRIQIILLLFSGALLLSLVLFTEMSTTANAMDEASRSITNTEKGSKELFVTGSDVFMTYFATECFALTISHTGSGTDPRPDPSKTPPCSTGQYLAGTTIHFLPSPDEHWFVGSWNGTDDGTHILTMPAADHLVTVNYKPICFALETKAVPTGGGAVVPSPAPSCPDPGPAAEYLEGTVVTLTATIFDGYKFSFWSGGVTGTITQTAVTMTSDYILTDTITANFDKACHPLFLTHAPPDKGSDPQADPIKSTGCIPGEYVFDENIALLNAIPIPSWLVDSWEGTDDNSSTSSSNTLIFPRLPASVGSGHFVTVNYIQKPTLNFSAATYTVNESAGSTAISVKRTGSLQEEVTVVVGSSDDTATAGQDYVPISKTLTFPKNIDEQTFSVQILDDILSEGTEYLILSLSEQSIGSEIGPQYEAELIILDDEGDPTVQFSSTTYEAPESSSTIPITITLYPPTTHDVFVEFKTLAGTAESGVDYIDHTDTIRFWKGETEPREPIKIIPINDELDEIDETVRLQLSDVVGAYLGASEAVLTLLDDDDPPSVQFSAGAYFAEEGDPTAPLTVTLSAATSLTVTVDYTVVEIPNGQPNVGNIKFNPREVSQTIDIPIATQKADDILSAVLSNVENASLAPPLGASLTIRAKARLDFSAAIYTVNENIGSVAISVKRTGSLQEKAAVLVKSSDDTATAGQDYVTISETLTFPKNIHEQTFTVQILDDSISERTESLILSLSNQSANADLGPQAEAVLTILDDDPPSVQFSAGKYFAEEGDPTAPLTVTLSAATSLTVTVDYTVVEIPNGQPIVGNIIFNPGEVSQTINLPIAGNQADDILSVQLSGEDNASLGSPSRAELIIHSKCYSLTLNYTGYGSPPTTNIPRSNGCRTGKYVAGVQISLVAQPDPGWKIDRWHGTQNDDDAVPKNDVLMPDRDHIVTADYITSTYLPYVSKDYMVFFDGPVEVEPNNLLKISQANGRIRSGQLYYGSFPTATDDYDVFFFNLTAKGTVQIDLMDIPAGRDYNLYLFSSDGVRKSFSGSVDNQNEQIISSNLDLGLYFVAIENAEGAPTTARYSLTVDFE